MPLQVYVLGKKSVELNLVDGQSVTLPPRQWTDVPDEAENDPHGQLRSLTLAGRLKVRGVISAEDKV